MRCKTLGVILLLVLAAVARSQDDAAKKDLKQMEGTWAVVVEEIDGKKATEETKKADVKLIVKADKYTVRFGAEQVATGVIKLDASKTPRQIDAIGADGEFKGKAMPGIYEVKGDTLRVCFAQPGKERPTEFRTREGTGQMLLSYKRIKP